MDKSGIINQTHRRYTPQRIKELEDYAAYIEGLTDNRELLSEYLGENQDEQGDWDKGAIASAELERRLIEIGFFKPLNP